MRRTFPSSDLGISSYRVGMQYVVPDLYIKPGCPWCEQVLQFLNEHDIHYRKIDVIADPKAFAEMIRISAQSKAPTMKWGDEILADFGVEELEPFLRKKKVIP